jgi:hypothetical protein
MVTRCKVRCRNVSQDYNGNWSYLLEPVTGGSPENDEYFKWTPSGKFEFGVTEERKFEAGKYYYVDFVLAE